MFNLIIRLSNIIYLPSIGKWSESIEAINKWFLLHSNCYGKLQKKRETSDDFNAQTVLIWQEWGWLELGKIMHFKILIIELQINKFECTLIKSASG